MNTEIFNGNFKYQNQAFFLKDLYRDYKATYEKIVNHVNDGLIGLRNAVNKNKFLKTKIPIK